MKIITPLFLLSAIALPVYVWLLRLRAKESQMPFSGGFLVDDAPTSRGGSRLVRLSFEDVLNCGLLCCLTLIGADVLMNTRTVVLTDGPVQLEQSLNGAPSIRAGIRPSTFRDAMAIPPVDTLPNWSSAIRLARQRFPGFDIVFRTSESPVSAIDGAGVRRTGNDWQLGVQTSHADVRVVDSNARQVKMRPTFGGFVSEDLGLVDWISVSTGNQRPQFICGPGADTLKVAKGRLPLALEQGLALHPSIEIVDEGGMFDVDPSTTEDFRHTDTFGFPVKRIAITFQKPTRFEPVELSLAEGLNLPVAQTYRWTGLSNSGVPFLFGEQHTLLAYYRDGDVGRLVFGFAPEDSDLVETAGWPVLMMKLGDYLLGQVQSCKEVSIERVLTLHTSSPVQFVSPDGQEQTLSPRNDVISIGGLDQVGKYLIFNANHSMWLMVRAKEQARAPVSAASVGRYDSNFSRPVIHLVPFWGAVCLLVVLLVFGSRRWWYFAAFALVLMVPLSERNVFGGTPRVMVVLDVSPSMKETPLELNTLSQIPGALPQRVDVANGVIRLSELTTAVRTVASSIDVDQIFEGLDASDHDADEFVFVTDARFESGEVNYPKPVSVLTVPPSGIDLRIITATAVEMDDELYVRVIVQTPGAIEGQLVVGGQQKGFSFNRSGEFSVTALVPRTERDIEVIEVDSPMDVNPDNNRLHVVVERPKRSDALVLGNCDSSLTQHLARFHRVTRFDGIEDFSNVQLAVICDQVLSAIPKTILGGLSRWLENGGSLVLSGREAAFGNGNWARSDLETVSPFRMNANDERPRTHLSVALDTSGSMSEMAGGSGAKTFLAVVPQWLTSMMPNDRISLASFDSRVTTIVSNEIVSQWRSKPWSVPTAMGGGTRFSTVVDWVVKSPVIGMRRYLLLVSDGEFADEAELDVHIERLRRSGIRVLAVGSGDSPNTQVLCTIARSTGGQCLSSGDSRVGRFLSISMSSGDTELDVPGGSVLGTNLWDLRVGGRPPQVARRVRVGLHENARLIAEQDTEPFVAERYFGLGRVIAIATDSWGLSPEQWKNLLSPALNQRDVNFRITVKGNRLMVQGRPTMEAPQGVAMYQMSEKQISGGPWTLLAPGRFMTMIPDEVRGMVGVNLKVNNRRYWQKLVVEPQREWVARQNAAPALRSLAERSGGVFTDDFEVLVKELSHHRPVGGLPLHLIILLGVIGLILLSVSRLRYPST